MGSSYLHSYISLFVGLETSLGREGGAELKRSEDSWANVFGGRPLVRSLIYPFG